MHNKTHPETGKLLHGHFTYRFSEYAEVKGYRIPIRITSDIILPQGEFAIAESANTEIKFDTKGRKKRSVA